MLNSPQKQLFWSGLIIIALTLTTNTILTKWLISQNQAHQQQRVQNLTRATDHLFTALIYLEKEKKEDFSKELGLAREKLRSPSLRDLRQKKE